MPVHFFEMFAFVFKKMHKLLFTERSTSLLTPDFIRKHLAAKDGARTTNLQRSGQRLLNAPPCNVEQTDKLLQIGHETSCAHVNIYQGGVC